MENYAVIWHISVMTSSVFEKRTARRDRLLGLLRAEDYWTTAQLRDQLGVSQRTLMRELAALRDAGYPIEAERGRGGGVRLDGRWGIERLQLSHQEVIELILSLAIIENLHSPLLTSNLKAIKQKLFQVFPHKQRHMVSQLRKRIMIGSNAELHIVSHYDEPDPRIAEPIASGFMQRKLIEIEYQSEGGEITSRKVEPQFILLHWPIWYIIAWDHLRDSSRVFRIDRIRAAKLLPQGFNLRAKDQFTGLYRPLHATI
jgi:predicted DNA-binding transcriptional regulator YafY